MGKKRETIYIDDNECGWINIGLWKYRGQYLAFVKELPDGSDEMAYCDENGNIMPDSPRVISIPGPKDNNCIMYVKSAWDDAEEIMQKNADNTFDNLIFHVEDAEYSLNRFWIEVYLPEYSNCAEYCFDTFDEMCDFVIPELGDSARHYLQNHTAEEVNMTTI